MGGVNCTIFFGRCARRRFCFVPMSGMLSLSVETTHNVLHFSSPTCPRCGKVVNCIVLQEEIANTSTDDHLPSHQWPECVSVPEYLGTLGSQNLAVMIGNGQY